MARQELVSYRRDGKRNAVVFIHGFCGEATKTWGSFGELLAATPACRDVDVLSFGYDTNLRPDLIGLWRAAPDIATAAMQLTTTARHELGNYESFDFVGHSMGGLVLQRAILDDLDLRRRTRALVCFGTPSSGLVKAWPFRLPIFRHLNRQVADMAEGGRFITSLRHDWNQAFGDRPPFRFLAVAGAADEFVPRSSSQMAFAGEFRAVVAGDHLSMVKPKAGDENANDGSLSLLADFLGATGYPPGVPAAHLARQRGDFRRTIDTLGARPAELDRKALGQLALAYDGLGQAETAIAILEQLGDRGTDAMGILAGRYKRRWRVERKEADARKALEIYEKAYGESGKDEDQRYYHAINVAFMTLAFLDDEGAARDWARRAHDHVEAAEAASARSSARHWRPATRGEARLIEGELEQGLAAYREALAQGPELWEIKSMYRQALFIADLRRDEALLERLGSLFGERE
ncbi:MAG: alpha/beta hydrolase [Planctomycetes bacterium]|nr:alpha/beta hydrolase [Planctomycetota bacterium]